MLIKNNQTEDQAEVSEEDAEDAEIEGAEGAVAADREEEIKKKPPGFPLLNLDVL
jgi:hypothetical protein